MVYLTDQKPRHAGSVVYVFGFQNLRQRVFQMPHDRIDWFQLTTYKLTNSQVQNDCHQNVYSG